MTVVRTQDADRYVAAPPEAVRLFLVHGSDAGAITERARMLERVALARGGGDSVRRIGSDELSANPGIIADEAYAASLFGGEPVIALRVLDGRHNVMAALAPLIERPPDAAWVIVEAAELNPSSPLRKAFEASKQAAAIPTYPLAGDDIAALIEAAAAESGVSVEPAGRDLLAENLGGDRLAVRGELEKLFLYLGEETAVTVEAVKAIVGDTTEAKSDHAIDAALLGDNEALETTLGRMRAEGSSPSALAALALRHLIQLQTLRAAVDTGERPNRAVDFARPPIFARRKPTIVAELERWPAAALSDARRRLDRAILQMRQLPALEEATLSETLHGIALSARRLRRRG